MQFSEEEQKKLEDNINKLMDVHYKGEELLQYLFTVINLLIDLSRVLSGEDELTAGFLLAALMNIKQGNPPMMKKVTVN